jgi:general secretion pathway protein D
MNNSRKLIKAACLLSLGLMLSSCELLGPKKAVKIPLTPVLKEQKDTGDDGVVFQELQNKQPVNDALQSKVELYPARDRFTPKAETHRRSAKTGAPGTYSLNFDDADLGEVAKVILNDILGQNYVLSPKVTGKVTLNTTEPLSKAELLPTLEMVLSMNNAALVKDGKIYHIEPKSDALYSSNVTGSSTGFQSRVIPIRNVAAQEIADILKPMVHEKTILNVDIARNALVIQGTTDELARVMDMISTFDIDVLRGRSFALFPLNNVEPEQVIEELESVFNTSTGKDDSEFFRFLPIERMNAVLAITHQASYLRDVENWIYRLDRANTEAGGGVNVYKAQHMDAEELADTLNEIFTGAGPRDKSAKVAAGRKSSEVSNKDSLDGANSQKSNKTSIKRKRTSSGGSSAGGGAGGSGDNETKIVADIANNSIIVVASPQEYAKILPVIKQLDIMPLQVLIDATIAQVDLKDELKYGIKWYFNDGNLGLGSRTGGGQDRLSARALNAAAAAFTGGLSSIYDAGNLKVLLTAQADLNNVKIISSPSLMVLNNQEAKINVGDQVPIQTSTLSNAIASTSTDNNNTGFAQANQIQYQDTGVTLEVTPRVNSNGMVIMDILQIVSVAKETVTGVTTSPTINKEEIESTIAVKDGETLALGGLIQTTNQNNKSGIPFLHEIPLIGPFFGSTDNKDNRQELVVLLTPRVVKTKQDARVVTDEFKRKLSNIYYDPTKPRRKGDWWRARDW